MSRIQGKNTKPEVLLRKALWTSGLRYRLRAKLPGRPDIAFTKVKVAVFIDGCFWHRCPIHGVMPKSNADFWKTKLNGNVKRDRKNEAKLRQQGWHVLRFWEHQVEEELVKVVKQIHLFVLRRQRNLSQGR
jgi:DNA mismatch endonuclease (patch repair protein)